MQCPDHPRYTGKQRRPADFQCQGCDTVYAAQHPDPDVADLQGQLEILKADNRSLMHSLADQKNRQAVLVQATFEAATTAIRQLELPAAVRPPRRSSRGGGETAIAVLSDWQLGKLTPSYSSEVCEERIELLADKIQLITEIQRKDHPVDRLWVPCLGDMVEGELIFPGQQHRIDASLFQQAIVDGPRILGTFLRRMASLFPEVIVDGVVGNHGEIGGYVGRREHHPETNADAFLYEVTRQVMAASGQRNVVWSENYVDGERMWYKVREINGQGWMILHGNQFKGGNGISGLPFPNMTSRVLKYATGGIREPFNYVLAGHHHVPTRLSLGGKTLWVSGSTESDNTYASEWFGSMGGPSQWLLFATDQGNVGGEYKIRLDSAAAPGE